MRCGGGVYVVWCYSCARQSYFMRKFRKIEIGRSKAFSEEQSTLPFVQGND